MGCLDQARFAVLFEDDREGEIRDQLLAISAALDQEVLAPLGDDPRLEASFGFAIFPRDAASAGELWTMGFQALADQSSSASVSSTTMRSA
jgi:GGDEF domain-containing protein